MNPSTIVSLTAPGRFRVGDRARVKYAFPGAIAEILEDRGPLGVGGRRFYYVRLTREDMEDMQLDWPEDELIPTEHSDGEQASS